MTPKRILHCLRAPVGGLFRHVCDLAIEQARRGHLVGVLCDETARDTLTNNRLESLSQHLELGLHQSKHPAKTAGQSACQFHGSNASS